MHRSNRTNPGAALVAFLFVLASGSEAAAASGTDWFFISDGTQIVAWSVASPNAPAWTATVNEAGGLFVVPNGGGAPVLLFSGSTTHTTSAFDAHAGTSLWTLPGDLATGPDRDAYGQTLHDPGLYIWGLPMLGGSEAAVCLTSGPHGNVTNTWVSAISGTIVRQWTGHGYFHGYIPRQTGGYDALVHSDVAGGLSRLSLAGTPTVSWASGSTFRKPLAIPDATGDGAWDVFSVANFNDSLQWYDGLTGAPYQPAQGYGSFDVLDQRVVFDDDGSADLILGAQGASGSGIRRIDSAGATVWSGPAWLSGALLFGLLRRGATQTTLLARSYPLGTLLALDAATGSVLWTIPFGGTSACGVADMDGDGIDDVLRVSGGTVDLVSGATGSPLPSFPPRPGVRVAAARATTTVLGGGQANSPAARLEINGIATRATAGPFQSSLVRGQPSTIDWRGPANQPYVLLGSVTLNPGAAVLAGFGSLDLGTPLGFSDVFVIFDGTRPPGALFHQLDASGAAQLTFNTPLAMTTGFAFAIQGLVGQPPGVGPAWARFTAAHALCVL